MKTEVVNVREEEEGTYTYVGRGSIFGNPFSHQASKYGGVVEVKDTAEAIARYRRWLTTDEEIPGWPKPSREAILALRGKRLGCYCAGFQPCHGDVIAELIELWISGAPVVVPIKDTPVVVPVATTVRLEDKIILGPKPPAKATEDELEFVDIKIVTVGLVKDISILAEEMLAHHCHAIGCSQGVPPELLMCWSHWQMVPRQHKAAVKDAYRPGQENDKNPSGKWMVAAERAICAVAVREKKMTATEAETRIAKKVEFYRDHMGALFPAKTAQEWYSIHCGGQYGRGHAHCPLGCEKPQGFVEDGVLWCGRCHSEHRVKTAMEPCVFGVKPCPDFAAAGDDDIAF